MPSWDLLLTDLCVATLCPELPGYGEVEDAAIAIRGDRIDWIGPRRDLPAGRASATPASAREISRPAARRSPLTACASRSSEGT